MKLGELIAIARECKGWTLRDMERETGISNALISQIEHGHVKDPGFSTVIRMARALGMSLDRVAGTVFNPRDILRTVVIGKVTGQEREGDQVPGMPGAICHACGLGYRCTDEDCPNTKTNPALVMQG
jgi:transcriptional regulator with XRE-family HTH domain